MAETQIKNLKWLYLAVLSLIWGTSFILIKKGLIGLTAIQVGSLRLVFAALFLFSIAFKELLKIPKKSWCYIALTALFGTFVPAYFFALAETEIDSAITSVLNSLTPLNTLILGILFFGVTFKRNQIWGIIIGLTGSCILILNGALQHPEQNYFYAILVLIATLCYAVNVNLIKKYLSHLDPLSITAGNFLILFLPALGILFYTNFFSISHQVKVQEATFYIFILGILGTGIANILFFKLIQIATPVFATSVTYLIPIVAIGWGLFDDEILTAVQILGAFVVLLGIYVSNHNKK
jgi:drug/metabolite transporter (DMT)-like permease